MRERVVALGGTLHAGPGADGGFSVRVTLPLPVPPARPAAAPAAAPATGEPAARA
jgi:signal transduction histidine kinase